MTFNFKSRLLMVMMVCLVLFTISGIAKAEQTEQILSFKQALQLGIENNAGLREKIIDEDKAQIDLNSAQKAFYPEVNVSSSYTRMFFPEIDDSATSNFPLPESNFDAAMLKYMAGLSSPNENNYQTSISIQQPIYLGGKIWLGMDQAKKGLKVAKVQVKQKKSELLFQIIQSYYNVLLAQERVDIEKEALDLVKEHKRIAQVGYKAGTVLKTDVLQVEIEEGKAIHSLEVAQNDLLMAKKMLGNTIGLDLTDKLMLWPDLNPDLILDKNKQFQIAKQNRPELKLLKTNKEVVETNLQMEENSKLPNIVLAGNHQWQGSEFSLKDGTSSITLSLSLNVFDRGLSKNKQDKFKEDLKKLDLNKANLEDMIMIDIEDTLLTIDENKNNLALQELNLKKATENLELETKRYKVGMGTNVNVMNAQMVLKQTRIARMQAEYQYKINLFKLLQKTGQLINYYEEVIISE